MRYKNDKAESHPMMAVLGAGTYYWCQCGRTHTVPFCDGSHRGSEITPLAFEVSEPGTFAVCNCGLTAKPPFCSGAHVEIE